MQPTAAVTAHATNAAPISTVSASSPKPLAASSIPSTPSSTTAFPATSSAAPVALPATAPAQPAPAVGTSTVRGCLFDMLTGVAAGILRGCCPWT